MKTSALACLLFAAIGVAAPAQFVVNLVDPSAAPPHLAQAIPAPGDVLSFTNVTIVFSESVTNVEAVDLLINGVPADAIDSTNDTTYTFSFAQPAYGAVLLNWETNHGIVDFDDPPRAFDADDVRSILDYVLINPSNPKVETQMPLAGATVTGLTEVVVTFTEAVAGVDAADLLVNGIAATNVSGSDSNYTFTFPPPAAGTVTIRWAMGHGIQDLEMPPLAFDPTRFGGQWDYTLVEPPMPILPAAPTNLVATATETNEIALTWADASTNETGFVIETSVDGGKFNFLLALPEGATNAVDTNLTAGVTYLYRVQATNDMGASDFSNVASASTPTNSPRPSIVEQPQSRTNLVGTTASFSVVAAGAEPLHYQWRHEGTPLADATNASLALEMVGLSQQGAYDAVVQNDFGSITSQVAMLVVNRPPVAGADQIGRARHGGTSVAVADLLANDSDADMDALTLDAVSPFSTNGGVVGLAGGLVSYNPPEGYEGDDLFTYTLTDGRGGETTGEVTVVVTNSPPVLQVIPDYVVEVLQRLAVTNAATDADLAANQLTFSLDPGAPANARLKSDTGVFRWAPTRAQAPSTNVITVRVTDDGVPPRSDARTFTVFVNDYVEVTAGASVVRAGETSSVPIEVFSSTSVTSLTFAVSYAGERLTNASIETLLPLLGDLVTETNADSLSVTFTAAPGETLQGTQQIAQLHFTTVAGLPSAFVPLLVTNVSATPTREGLAPGALASHGRTVVIDQESLVEPKWGTNAGPDLIVYGRLGSQLNVESSTNVTDVGSWVTFGQLTLTNLVDCFSITNPPPPLIFYRARE